VGQIIYYLTRSTRGVPRGQITRYFGYHSCVLLLHDKFITVFENCFFWHALGCWCTIQHISPCMSAKFRPCWLMAPGMGSASAASRALVRPWPGMLQKKL
jgi:hypothetical protein